MNFDKPLPIWYWILMIGILVALFRTIASGLNRDLLMSRTARFVRVVLGSVWAAIILVGMVLHIWTVYVKAP